MKDAVKQLKTLFINPGSPLQNCYSESFNSGFRDEFLNVERFTSLLEATMLSREHRYKYNHSRPHSPLGDLTPAEFAAACLNPPPDLQPGRAETTFIQNQQTETPPPTASPRRNTTATT